MSSSYLIILYSRPVVLIIEILPVVVAKFALPHLFYYVPYWLRPLGVGFLWTIATFVSSVTPPNVEPPVRVGLVFVACSLASATDVSTLGLLRYYGKLGLVGWGFGTGVGGIICAVMAYVVTVGVGGFLRDSITYAYYLNAMILLAYYVGLPGKPSGSPARADAMARNRVDLSLEDAEEPSGTLLVKEPQPRATRFVQRVEQNVKLASSLTGTYMLPLFFAFVGQAIVFPGIMRALGTSPAFDSFLSYSAVYGLAFQLGNLVSRSSILFVRYQKARPLLIRLGIVAAVIVINASFLIVSLPFAVFALAFLVGLIGGAVYINTFAAALEDPALELDADREFSLGVLGSGESAGTLVGALFGTLLGSLACGMELGAGQRWCHATK